MLYKKPNTTRILFLITISALTFLYLFLLVASNGQLALNDFHFLDNVNKFSPIKATVFEYQNYNTSFISAFLTHVFLNAFGLHWASSLFFLLNLCIWLFSLYNLVSLLKQHKVIRLRTRRFTSRFIAAIFLLSAIFYQSFKINETWFWLYSSPAYSLSLAFAILGFTIIFKTKKGLFDYLLLALSFFYVGGTNEPLALMIVLFLFYITFYLIFKQKNTSITQYISLGLAFAMGFIAFLIHFIGPGNTISEQAFEHITLGQNLVLNIKMTGIILIKKIPIILPYTFLFGIALQYYLIKRSPIKNRKTFLKKLFWSTFIYVMSIYLQQLPVTFKTQNIAINYTLYPIALYTLVYVGYIIYQIFCFWRPDHLLKRKIFIVCFGLLIGLNLFQLVNQHKKITQYTMAYKERLNFLITHRHNSEILKVAPLPESGWLMSAEISENPNNPVNQYLKQGLKIKSNIKLKK